MADNRGETKQGINLADFAAEQARSEPGGDLLVNFDELPAGATIEMRTESRTYSLEYRGNGEAMIKGHPRYCPDPVLVTLQGSSWDPNTSGPLIIRRGAFLVYRHPSFGLVRTSAILEARPIVHAEARNQSS